MKALPKRTALMALIELKTGRTLEEFYQGCTAAGMKPRAIARKLEVDYGIITNHVTIQNHLRKIRADGELQAVA